MKRSEFVGSLFAGMLFTTWHRRVARAGEPKKPAVELPMTDKVAETFLLPHFQRSLDDPEYRKASFAQVVRVCGDVFREACYESILDTDRRLLVNPLAINTIRQNLGLNKLDPKEISARWQLVKAELRKEKTDATSAADR